MLIRDREMTEHRLYMNADAVVYLVAEVDGVPVEAGDRGCIREVNKNSLTIDFTTASDPALVDVAAYFAKALVYSFCAHRGPSRNL